MMLIPELSLVIDVPTSQQPDWIDEFTNCIDQALPGFYTFFAPESRHITIRALMPA